MTNPKVQPQARLEIYEGITVETVKQKGSDGQKMMVSLFDQNRDGVLDEREAAYFNSCNFKVEEGKITMYENKNDGTKNILELKYDNFEEDILNEYNGHPLNSPHHFNFKNNKGESCAFAKLAQATKTCIDMITGKVTIEGVKEGDTWIGANNVDLTVKNSDINEIKISGGSLKLENTKDETILWDRETTIVTDGKTTIEADKNSKYKIEKQH